MSKRRKRNGRVRSIPHRQLPEHPDPLDEARMAAGLPTEQRHRRRPPDERALSWMSTVADVATAMGVEQAELRALIERHARVDWGDELVARLPRATLAAFLGPRMTDDASLAEILSHGVVCRRLSSKKRDIVPNCFHGPDGETLTDWVVFVRAYEGKPAEIGDTSVSRLPPASEVYDGYAGHYLRLRVRAEDRA